METLEKQVNELRAKNNNAEFTNLENKIRELSEQINAIEIPECPAPQEPEEEY